MLRFMWNFVIKARIPNVPTSLDYSGGVISAMCSFFGKFTAIYWEEEW